MLFNTIFSMIAIMGRVLLSSVALLALAQSVYGQGTTTTFGSSTGTASTVRAVATYKISVGIDHKFSPDITQALIGDLIEFDFMPLNHSVVRAE